MRRRTKKICAAAALVLMALWIGTPEAAAHPPFGSSAQATLLPDRLEVFVTSGSEVAKGFLKDVSPDSTRPAAPGEPYVLPAALAPRFFEIAVDGQPLAASRVELQLNGVDYEFALIYPRPAGALLRFRALYLESLPAPAVVPLTVANNNGQPFGSALLSVDQNTLTVTLPQAESTATPPAPVPGFGKFVALGIEHILTGYDHLLFLAALLLGCRRVGPMLGVITCFTTAHSLTLALAALNWVAVSSPVIEPLIAASILCVALENFRSGHSTADRCALAFGFGMIHGFGFASALRETGLGTAGWAMVRPLFSFNLGVECGQLSVAAVVLPLLFQLRRWPVFARHGTATISVLIAVISGYWLVERTLLAGGQ